MLRVLLIVAIFLVNSARTRADSFDNYTNPLLVKIAESKSVEKVAKLTTEVMVENSRVLPGITGTFLVVKTNEGRWAKLLVQPARHKVSAESSIPIALIERTITFREGDERRVHAKGENVRLFHDFRFNLDIGQIVPTTLGGDLRFVAEGEQVHLEPVGKAEMYLVKEHLAQASPNKGKKLVVGEKFEPRYFNGIFKLYDDGRRSGMLHLKVEDNNTVSGFYYSDKDGTKYEIAGKLGNPNHTVTFFITFPQVVQHFTGFIFTGDGRAITGTTRLQERETGFYALRVEE